jgi:hypothetical protein
MSCCNENYKRKQNKEAIKSMAIRFAVANQEDVQIHTWTDSSWGRLYDFEPVGKDRGRGLVEVIKFRDHTSTDVLQDKEIVKPTKRANKRSGSKKNKVAVSESNEPVGSGNDESATESLGEDC